MYINIENKVCDANKRMFELGLVIETWGNVSEIDRNGEFFAIKPSGVPFIMLKRDNMVLMHMNGKAENSPYKPSSDWKTHLQLYKSFESIGAICHTHSTYATIFAQAGREIPVLGTTHADYFCGRVPLTRDLTEAEISKDYEQNTGLVIVERFSNLNPLKMVAVLVKSHGVFTFGKDAAEAVMHAAVLEEVAKMAYFTLQMNPQAQIDPALMNKHYERKHGKDAYYGQN